MAGGAARRRLGEDGPDEEERDENREQAHGNRYGWAPNVGRLDVRDQSTPPCPSRSSAIASTTTVGTNEVTSPPHW